MLLSLLARLLTFFLLPSTPSFLGPDEGTYAALARWVADSKDVQQFPVYGPILYFTSKTIVLPASWLIDLGMNQIAAVRLVSLFFGLLGIYFFAKTMFLLLGINEVFELTESRIRALATLALLFFAFMPSVFLWSVLGLRESASIAMLLASVFFLLRIQSLGNKHTSIRVLVINLTLAVISISLFFGARRQTAIVFIVFFCTLFLIMRFKSNFMISTITVLIGFGVGLYLTTAPVTKELLWTKTQTGVNQDPKDRTGVNDDNLPLENCEVEGELREDVNGIWLCVAMANPKKAISFADIRNQAPVKNLDELANKRNVNRLGAQTSLPETRCNDATQSFIDKLGCTLGELPYRLISFLFRPFVGLDQGSFTNFLASLENILWFVLITIFTYVSVFFRKYRSIQHFVLPVSSFVLAFSCLAALYEGNLGTAFRHKSTILGVVLLVIVVFFNAHWRESEKVTK